MSKKEYADLRGQDFLPPKEQLASNSIRAGDPLVLVREPTNRFDKNAIRVKNQDGLNVGYVAKERAAVLAPLMDKGTVITASAYGRKVLVIEY